MHCIIDTYALFVCISKIIDFIYVCAFVYTFIRTYIRTYVCTYIQ